MRRSVATCTALIAVAIAPAASASLAEFDARSIEVRPEVINDLGIADVDGDRDSDIYSTNHSNPSTILRNDGGWTFTDAESSLGFEQTPEAPSWNQLSERPDVSSPGLYIWAGWDYIEIHSSDDGATSSGRLSLFSPVEATTSGGAEVAVVKGAGNPPPTEAQFTIPPGGHAVLQYTTPGHSFGSTTLRLDEGYPLERVHLGAAGDSPRDRAVHLNLRDRHAMVWGQFDSDPRPDVMIARGGLKRTAFAVDRRPSDELFVRGDAGFTDRARALGLGGQVCSAREGRQLDLGSGPAAELLIACRSAFPRVYRRGLFGFAERRDEMPRQVKGASWYLPFDLGPGAGRTLILRRKHKVHLIRIMRRQWKVIQSIKLRTRDRSRRNHKRIARGDLDGDGDMDAFVPDAEGSTLLVNRGGRLRAISPKSRKLPRASRAAAMVDFDLDGKLDLHLLPQGMFRQRIAKRFTPHRDPEARGIADSKDLSVSWADLDGDLDLDALVGEQPADTGQWQVRALENVGETGNAIRVRAAGRIENAVALGARVTVKAGRKTLVGWVGQNNTNSYGQGNYDLVFGLGDETQAKRVKVVWPDRTKSRRRNIPAGTTLTMTQPRGRRDSK